MSQKKPDPKETNSAVDKKARRYKLSCPICPPNRGENASRRARHGAKTPKYKTLGRSARS